MTQLIDFSGCLPIPGKGYNVANGKKINYYDFLMTGEDANCTEAVKRIVPV